MQEAWDKLLASKLLQDGLTFEQAMLVVGIVAEERQIADRDGYIRGYNNGFRDAEKKHSNKK
jgi:hypothetical protein